MNYFSIHNASFLSLFFSSSSLYPFYDQQIFANISIVFIISSLNNVTFFISRLSHTFSEIILQVSRLQLPVVGSVLANHDAASVDQLQRDQLKQNRQSTIIISNSQCNYSLTELYKMHRIIVCISKSRFICNWISLKKIKLILIILVIFLCFLIVVSFFFFQI